MKTRCLIATILTVSFVGGVVLAGTNSDETRARFRKKVQEQKQIQEDYQYQNQYRYEKQICDQDDELMELLKGTLVETDGWKEKVRIRQQDQKKLGEQECDGSADQTRLQKQLRGDSLEEDPEYQEFLKYFAEEPLRDQLQTRIRDQKKTGDEDCEPIQQRDQTREQKQDQLKDGSCQDEEEVLKASGEGDKDQLQTRIRDQKKTGDEDCEPIQQRDQTREQKQDQLKDGSCQDEEEVLKAGGDQEPDQTRNQQQIREQKKEGSSAAKGLLQRIMERMQKRLILNGSK
jgi:hypothetical protein